MSQHELINDYRTAHISRSLSLVGRKEVLGGRAKFGIFGDGKEIAQIALAKVFEPGDWRSGYYRDQTMLLALGVISVRQFFSQLYADTDLDREPQSGGRQMNCHFGKRYYERGQWVTQTDAYNCSADISPTGGQMARLLGLGYASKLYRQNRDLDRDERFSRSGNEIAFGTIGDASTSEGIFWETMNAAGVLQVPVLMSVWDDGYGISVPNRYQTIKGSISQAMSGMNVSPDEESTGLWVVSVDGRDFEATKSIYQEAAERCRKHHQPCLVHVHSITQPQGHSTSGSHERYKSPDRLQFEKDQDGLVILRQQILDQDLISSAELAKLESSWEDLVNDEQQQAWRAYREAIDADCRALRPLLVALDAESNQSLAQEVIQLDKVVFKRDLDAICQRSLIKTLGTDSEARSSVTAAFAEFKRKRYSEYSSFLYCEEDHPSPNPPVYADQSSSVDGRQVIQKFFELMFKEFPSLFVLGEDVGKLGGVNLEFEGLQEQFGEHRITDTGIREATILGQAIGAAMRGLRPIADIQYLDYLAYCIQILSDDLATLHYRTAGGQVAPVIVRTKGHRLEGIWHTGSPMALILGSCRGVYLCVPRNAVQACGMYRTLLAGDNPGIVIEVLNGYRVKERLPENLGDLVVPLGVPDKIRDGQHITVVTYGANVRIAQLAADFLSENLGVDLEIFDIQTLIPFDTGHLLRASVEKTHAIVFFDEDVQGGATAYMMQQVLENQHAYVYLDASPRTVSARDHRSAYGTDGDYYSKPNEWDLITTCYEIMRDRYPGQFPAL